MSFATMALTFWLALASSHVGVVQSWPELGALLLASIICLLNVAYSMFCFGIFLWAMKPDGMKAQV